ncbi:MAG: hypothetical protein HYR75_04445 [Gemmatimonadetes bacterium]|nr:hypothetical protein [Gemmatimonadota bacterium]MBI3566699.1 hypothetical protein [Gemmatimonadota bacterium]
MRLVVPSGYTQVATRGTRAVAHTSVAAELGAALSTARTLHGWAAARPEKRPLQGRETAWRVTLDDGTPIVVRHSRHGGFLAPLTGDLFLAPTRAPGELAASARLLAAGVPTPQVLAWAVYPAFGPFARADVVTRALDGADLPDAWAATPDPAARQAIVRAVATLLRQLRHAGAVHPDLNLKNVFIAAGDAPVAYVLDVDRIRFREADSTDAAYRNLVRLVRSARKWRAKRGLDFDEQTFLEPLALTVGARGAP